jgi:hypothetical protein
MFVKFFAFSSALAGGILFASQPVLFANSSKELKARAYWENVEQRPGQTEILFLRLEADTPPAGPLVVRLTLPPSAHVEAGETGWLQNLWNKVTGRETGLERRVAASDWKRGKIVSNSVKTYFTYREVPEKRWSATTSWKITCQQPLDAQGSIEVSSPGSKPLHLPVRLDFREGPKALETGEIPPPQPVGHDYLVGALYYPGWVPGHGSGWNLLDPYPERKPALGYHDGSSANVSDWEIKWALENGINFFVYCWYAPFANGPVKSENLFLGQTLHDGLLKSRFLNQFHFAILWENSKTSASRERLLGELLPFWIENYFKNPSYLSIGGKPVLFVYDVKKFINNQGGLEAAKESVRLMREALVKAGFQGLWIAGEHRGTDAAVFKNMEAIGVDASFPYCYGFPKPAENQAALDEIMKVADKQDALSPIPVIATASVSWDPQPWIDYIDYPWHAIPFWLDPQHFKECVELMKKRIDARPGDNPLAKRMLLIDNWNEYAEGHWVAPSRKEGFRYLNAIRDVFAPQAAGCPNTLPEDAGLSPDESAYNAWREKMRARLK